MGRDCRNIDRAGIDEVALFRVEFEVDFRSGGPSVPLFAESTLAATFSVPLLVIVPSMDRLRPMCHD